ncbi:penicillin-binding protein [Ignavibacteria bacterium]|nr:PASTA domain-containing protein [Bacteroidota bacterium]MCZ2133730.1 PASTA domain-containing protein [Bacteroidota bacterium]
MINDAAEDSDIPRKTGYEKRHLWKMGALQVVLLAALGVIASRLIYLQVLRKNDLQQQARRQYESRIELKPRRGIIYDANKTVLAATAISYSYAIDPKTAADIESVAQILARITKDSASVWLNKIRECKTSFLWLIRGRQHTVSELEDLRRQGVIRIIEPRRRYPFGNAGGQAVGMANVDNIGVSGVEAAEDSLLRGKPGFAVMLRDGHGAVRSALDVSNAPSDNGANVITTLDMRLQQIAEYELRQGIESAQAVSGIVIAIEPSSGEIRALCSFPSFDPGVSGGLLADATRIRGISDMYEPGSTFKIIAAAASLEENLVKPSDSVDGEGGTYRVGNFEVKDSHPLGKITFRQALEQSSNIVFAKQTGKIPDGKFYKYARDFGFGVASGIDLPGEVAGVLKKPRQFDNTTKMFMGYGYELSASALQIVNAYATVANAGVMMKPYIIKEVFSDDGKVLQSTKPQIVRRVISDKTATTLADMLRGVTKRGTGTEADVAGLDVAGKTGTAQQVIGGVYSKEAYTASFVGFFPVSAPRIAMIIMLDRPKTDIYGGKTAAPIFRRIAERWAGTIGVEPAITSTNLTKKASDTALVPELRGLSDKEAHELLHRNGLRLNSPSAGIVVSQSVMPGAKVEHGREIAVQTQPPIPSTDGNLSRKQEKTYTPPDVRGIPLRRAIAILHNSGVSVKVFGKGGKVVHQIWNNEAKSLSCTIECSDK